MTIDMLQLGHLMLCGCDAYLTGRFFSPMFKRKCTSVRFFSQGVVTALSIFFVNAFGNSQINLICVPVILLLFVLASFQISISNAIIYTFIFFVVFAGGKEVAFEILFRFLAGSLPMQMPQWFIDRDVPLLIIEYIFTFLFLLLIERFTKELEILDDKRFSWYLLVMPVATLLILGSFLYMDFPDDTVIQVLMCAGSFLLYFSNVAIFIILGKAASIMNQMKYMELYQMKQGMEGDNFQNVLKLNERYQHYIHDMQKYFNTFRLLVQKGESEKIVFIINELEGNLERETKHLVYCGDSVLNTVLVDKAIRAQEKDVEFNVFIEQFLNLDFISGADKISLFGNLLDNAIEAAANCETGERKVDMKLFMGNQYLMVFYIKNSFTGTILKNGNQFLTTKKNVYHHGLGIGIAERLAEKYGGSLFLEEEEGEFVTTLMISVCKN